MSKRQRGSIPPFTRVEHDTRQQSAYRQIRDAMMTGGFRPGQRVSIRAVAGAMGISAMPVREAMWRLETLALSGTSRVAETTVRRQLWAALDVIVQTERRVGRRRVTSIAYVGDDIEEVYRCS